MRIVTREETKKGTTAIGYLIEQRLRARSVAEAAAMNTHPDENTITAFVEARLGAEEYGPVVSHLIECGVCRHTTAQLVRLESELGETDESTSFDDQPSRLSSFINGLVSHIVPASNEDTVFAYQNPESDESTESPSPAEEDPDQSKTN